MRHRLLVVFLSLILAPVTAFPASRSLQGSWRFPARPGKRIVVDTSDMDVRLRIGDVTEIQVTVTGHISNVTARQAEGWVKGHTPEMNDSDGTLRIETRKGPKGILGHLTAKAQLSIVAPLDTVPDLATLSGDITVIGDFPTADPLRLATMTGDLSFLGAAVSLTAIATSGKVNLQVVRPLEDLTVRTTSGRVTFTGGTRKASVDTASGDISLENLSGAAEISTSSGNVDLSWDRLGRRPARGGAEHQGERPTGHPFRRDARRRAPDRQGEDPVPRSRHPKRRRNLPPVARHGAGVRRGNAQGRHRPDGDRSRDDDPAGHPSTHSDPCTLIPPGTRSSSFPFPRLKAERPGGRQCDE